MAKPRITKKKKTKVDPEGIGFIKVVYCRGFIRET